MTVGGNNPLHFYLVARGLIGNARVDFGFLSFSRRGKMVAGIITMGVARCVGVICSFECPLCSFTISILLSA